ncbi:YqcI/YcgG family protein [Micromonospora sp. WMMD1120]|uniref:YqcI/YcgG family protein n=1 Tax=Micromonospora sp. WMMD1120 TaxID=3016106 RepID=UPI0024164BAA|nr:YqcI/YcgG family protein [Micromonospora sp. WMMD1120]MDG4808720.1 YqcI/YcgG family protein [Micromonospora sp. WMMD1120]
MLRRVDRLLAEAEAVDCSPRLLELARDFEEVVNTREFPCVFSTQPFTTREIYFDIVRGADAVESRAVTLLRELCDIIRDVPDAIGVIFVDDAGAQSIDDEFKLATRIVQAVMNANALKHPDAVLPKPHESSWTLWLEDTGLFLNFSSPLHTARRSRNVGSTLTIIAQARDSFDRQGRASPKVRSEIRRRVAAYDDVAPHPCLGSYTDPDSREALQFFLGNGLEPYDPTGGCLDESA